MIDGQLMAAKRGVCVCAGRHFLVSWRQLHTVSAECGAIELVASAGKLQIAANYLNCCCTVLYHTQFSSVHCLRQLSGSGCLSRHFHAFPVHPRPLKHGVFSFTNLDLICCCNLFTAQALVHCALVCWMDEWYYC